MGKSASDFTLTISRGKRGKRILSVKDIGIDPGGKATAQMSNSGVAFIALGAGGPACTFTCVDGDEAAPLGVFMTNPATGKSHTDMTATLVGRNASGTIVAKWEEAAAAEGRGKLKISEADGFTGDGAIKIISKRFTMSVNGGAPVRFA